MSSSTPFALLANATSLPWAEVPEWPLVELVNKTSAELGRGARLCSFFGLPESEGTRLVAVIAFDADNTLAVARSLPSRGEYPSLTLAHAQAHLFEREIWEEFGLTPIGHPWLKPVRKGAGNAPANGEFFRVEGREIHEVGVGPVHAGIIEPGHFRFQCAGEEVIHLEIALGYQHRGIERALVGGPYPVTVSQMEVVAGDTTIGHATAHAQLMEAMADAEPPLRAQWIRALALELERRAGQRCRFPAHVSRVRKDSRRLSQSHRAALRQPLWPPPRPPGWLSARSGYAAAGAAVATSEDSPH
jgi:hypothetical protein